MLRFPNFEDRILPHNILLDWPHIPPQDDIITSRITGSLVGLAVGDALGASVEFRPHEYLVAHPVRDMMPGGTWGLRAGQWTDDTSMALCLASSLITKRNYDPYDQMVRYKWWYKFGYLSSTGQCFDIGNATRNALEEFTHRQKELKRDYYSNMNDAQIDRLPLEYLKNTGFDFNCSGDGVAGNGALMRLAPVPLFFYRNPPLAVELSGKSARLTHGDKVAVDACRYYGALIVAAVNGESKERILSNQFYRLHRDWFGSEPLHPDILSIAEGSYQKSGGYNDGIRGKGHIVWALEAALWAFWSSSSFKEGALNAVNLGDDTDTTAAIYGQLAGAVYGPTEIPEKWVKKLYARNLIICVARWLQHLSFPVEQPPLPLQRNVHNRSRFLTTSHHFDPTDVSLAEGRRIRPKEESRREPMRDRPLSAPRPKNNGFHLFGCMGKQLSTDV